MAINEKQWNAMIPGVTKILDNDGHLWSVKTLIPDPRRTIFIIDRDGDRNPLEYYYVPENGNSQSGIIEREEHALDVNLNHPDTYVDGTKPTPPEAKWRNTLNPEIKCTVSMVDIAAVDGIAWERGIIFTIEHVISFPHGKGFMFRVKSIGSMHSGQVVIGTDETAYNKALAEGTEVFNKKVANDKKLSENIAKLPK